MKPSLAAVMLSLCLAGCGTSADPAFYTLTPVKGTGTANIGDTINVARPVLPGFLDRPDFVSQDGNRIRIDETANWTTPLDERIEQVLADDLQQRLPAAMIQTDAGDEPAAPRLIIETAFRQFNALANGTVMLRAQLTVTDRKAGTTRTLPIQLQAESAGDPAATAAALSQLLGQYADRIAACLGTAIR